MAEFGGAHLFREHGTYAGLMKIKTKILLTVLGMSLLVALVGGLAVNRQRASALVAVTTEAEHVARVLGFLLSGPANLPGSTQEIIAKLHRTEGRDVVLVDAQKHILADAAPAKIGATYAADPHGEVGLTLQDRQVRTFTEVSNDSAVAIKQIVVPVEVGAGRAIGAVVLEYTPFYDEQMRLTTATIREVGVIGSVGAALAILLALNLGRSITAPLGQLTQAATRFTAGQRDLPMPAAGTDEIGELVAAFNRMMEKRDDAEEALRRIHDELEARVTERTGELTAASEALTWKTAFLEASVNSSLEGILVVDSRGKRILQNQQMIDVWKMPREIAEEEGDENRLRWVTGMTMHPDQFIEKVVYLYAHPHEISQDEIELKDRRILERYSSPVFGRDGQYCGRIWKFRDITERKRADETLRESEEKFRQLADNISDAFWVRSPDMKTLHLVTAGYEKIWGRPSTSLYAEPNTWVDAMIPADREHVVAAYTGLMGDEPQMSVEYRIARPDGAIRWVHARGFQIRDAAGKLVRLVGILSDITERKQADLAQARFAAIMEMTTDLVCVADPHGHVLYINRAGRRMMSLDEQQDVTRTSIADYHSGPHLQRLINECIPTAMREGVWSGESMFMSRDGREFPLAQVVVAHKGSDGKVDFLATTGQDLTERKKVDAELLRAKEVAEAANRAKREFLANMSHEIRTPMNGIMGMTELVLETELNEEQREYLTMASESAQALLVLIDDILDFSKIEVGLLALEETGFSLQNCLDSTLKPLRIGARQKGLDLTANIAEGVPDALIGDPLRLRQIIINLVANAIKFTKHGSIRLRVEPGTETELAQPGKRCLHFSVTDSGIGVAAEKQALIFEAFAQADSSTTRTYGGTGLGLTIASQLVKQMGGKIRVESAVGIGTTFHFSAYFTLGQPATGAPVSRGANAVLPVDKRFAEVG